MKGKDSLFLINIFNGENIMTIQKTLALVLVTGAAVATNAHSKFYVGGDVGYSRTDAHQKGSVTSGGVTYSDSARKNVAKGFDTAIRLGFMKNVNSFLWGFETSLGYATGSSSKTSTINKTVGGARNTLNLKSKLTRGFTTDVIAKLGGKFNKTSVYGLGGIAFAQFKENIDVNLRMPGVVLTGSHKHTRMLPGLTFGAGVMYDVTDKVAVKVEYRRTQHSAFNTKFVANNGTNINVKIKPATDAFMTGVVYNF